MIEIDIRKCLASPAGDLNIRISLDIEEGSLVAITGESGSGKTSLLRMIAGLLMPDEGTITAGGNTWYDSIKKTVVKANRRDIGFVFQDYALFPNMTVKENIAFGCGMAERVSELMDIMELNELGSCRPDRLSGGEKQRVALARAIARNPKMLLMDEPLSALDGGLRQRLQDELLRIHGHFKCTILFVSHDLLEISRLASRVIVLDRGKVMGDGPPVSLLHNADTMNRSLNGKIVSMQKNGPSITARIAVGETILEVLVTDEEARKMSKDRYILNAGESTLLC